MSFSLDVLACLKLQSRNTEKKTLNEYISFEIMKF